MPAIKPPPVRTLQGPGTLALLMALSALGQLGVNLVLPVLPVIGQAVGLATGDIGLILSAYLLGLAVGQLVVGPLSDRIGRRPVLLSGLALFALAGLGLAFATGATGLLVLRALQGAGASASLALARAVARDLFDGPALVRVIALVTMAMAVVPGLAPIFGGVLTETAGWRGTFGFAGAAGAAMLLLVIIRLPETNASPLPSLNGRDVARLYASLLGHGAFMRNALSNALLLAALYGFFAGAPLVLIGPGKLTPTQFGLVPAATSVTYLIGGWVLLRAADRPAMRRAAIIGARAATVLGSLLMLGAAMAHELGPWTTMAGASVYALGLGGLLPVGAAGALMPFSREAGSASALLGALQMVVSALAGVAVGWIGGDPAIAFPAVMLACVTGAVVVGPRQAGGA